MKRRFDQAQKGFVLPMTLWVIAIIALVLAAVSQWVAVATSNAQVLRDKVDTALALSDIRNELIFVLARKPYSIRGLEAGSLLAAPQRGDMSGILSAEYASDRVIRLDGRPYIVEADDRFIVSLQDGRGLVNLNTATAPFLLRLLDEFDVDPEVASQLSDTLLDYRDEDDFKRLAGAERDDYERLGLYPPSNFQFLTPWEAQRVIGWAEQPAIWRRQYDSPLLTSCRSSGFNPNTAPAEAIMTFVGGITQEQAKRAVEQREFRGFRNTREFGDSLGTIIVTQPFFFSFLPARCFIVDVVDRNSGERTRFSLTLLPRETSQPWQIDYVLKIPREFQELADRIDTQAVFPSAETVAGIEAGDRGIAGL